MENGIQRLFRTADLLEGADRLSVGCVRGDADECYLATGGSRAWRFDGQTFQVAPIDPELGSRVLVIVSDPKGDLLAIHRGAAAPQLRISRVDNGRWTPIAMQAVEVPSGAPAINFAQFAPDGHLWIGLRYTDRDKEAIDYGAAELELDAGKVIYHRQVKAREVAPRLVLPNDTVAMYCRSPAEQWFATRSGAAVVRGGHVRLYTENDAGMDNEIIHDIGPGLGDEIWVATRRGVGTFDGARWRFPKLGPFYLPATSLAYDGAGHRFIGTDRGLFCVGDCIEPAIDARRGLLDDKVRDLAVDARGRVWALTEKGISVIDP
jgi:hypothetical protein